MLLNECIGAGIQSGVGGFVKARYHCPNSQHIIYRENKEFYVWETISPHRLSRMYSKMRKVGKGNELP
jgi:hypothetical protein